MSSLICPECQYSNPTDHLYCQNCGTKLPDAQGAEAESSGYPQAIAADRQSSIDIPPSAPASSSKSRLSLWLILLAGGAVMFCGLVAFVTLLLVWGSDDAADAATDGAPPVTAADLESFRPDPAGGQSSVTGETVSSDSGTVTIVLPEEHEWDVLATDDRFISLEHLYGYMDIGVYRSDFPTTPEELMDEEVEWMQEEFSGSEVVVGPEYFEFENGNGVMFVMAYDIDLLVLDIPEIDVYAFGVDPSGTVVLSVNFYGFEEDWDEFTAAVEPVVQSIRSPLFE
jgi:hypothetical protein